MRDDAEFNIQFCQLVEQYPVLYDYSSASYSNRNVQDKLWGEISKKLGASDKEVKERWRNIRGRYSKYIKSINMIPSGSAAKTTKEYYLAPHLHYLDNFVKSRTPKSNLSNLENIENSEDDSNLLSDLTSPRHTTTQHSDIVPLPTSQPPRYALKDVNKTAMEYFSSRTKEINSKKNSLDKDDTKADTDLAFLQSMLPDLKSMTQNQKRKFKIGVLNLSEQILSEPLPRPTSYSRTSYRSESPYTRSPSSYEIPYQRSSSRESDYNPSTPGSPINSTVQQTTSRPELSIYTAPTVQQTQTFRPELNSYNTGIQLPIYSPVTPATFQLSTISNENVDDYDDMINNL